MAEVTASMVRELREKTSAGMMDCKKALIESAGDMEAAVDWLRAKGLSQVAKKSGRATTEGLVGVASDGQKAAMVEVNAETDFVARNESFQNFVLAVAQAALDVGDNLEVLLNAKLPSGRSVSEELTHLIATIGENMSVRRACVLSVSSGVVAHYVHGALRPGLGKIGVLVALEAPSSSEALRDLGYHIGIHITAMQPVALDIDCIHPDLLERERQVLREQARNSGKPENIIEKMIEGRIRKFYEEVALLEQVWMIDGETRVSKIVADAEAKVIAFERFQLGEGIEKEESDFAAEVAAAAGA